MKQKLLLILVLSLLCIHALISFEWSNFTLPELPTNAARSNFTNFSQRLCLFTGVALFVILVCGPTASKNEVERFSPRVWFNGVFFILGITTTSVLIFNPTGAFTWNIDRIANQDTRVVKPYKYNQLNPLPDIVFLGTSISHPIRAQEFAQKFSLNGYNFSVLGGTPIDNYALTNFMLSKPIPAKKPTVIITELLSPSLSPTHIGVKFYERYPIEYATYMPLEFSVENISTHIDKIFTISSFSQIFYVEHYIRNNRWVENDIWKSDDGAGKTIRATSTEATYKRQVARTGNQQLDKLLYCDELNQNGKDAIFKMVALSKVQHVSIIFYRSPVNDDFYTLTKKKPKIYKPCEEKFNQFMQQIQKENPNVFFIDLSHYEPVTSGGRALYLDSHHLNSMGSSRVLDALTPTVQEAIEYAQSK